MPIKDRRSYAQRADYLKKAVIKRRKKIREMAVSYKGGQCQICGYSRCHAALEFHHPDPTKKDFSISADGSTRSWKRVQAEIEKCVLVCANCHREVHAGITQLSRVIEIELEVNCWKPVIVNRTIKVISSQAPSSRSDFTGKVQRLSLRGVGLTRRVGSKRLTSIALSKKI